MRAQINRSELTKTMDALLALPELEDLDKSLLKELGRAVAFDALKDKLAREVMKQTIDEVNLEIRWLRTFKSAGTRNTYRKHLESFRRWKDSLSLLEVDTTVADDYLAYLLKQRTKDGRRVAANYVRVQIAACSSFWQTLVRWGVIIYNPWHGIRLPERVIETKKPVQIPTKADLAALKAEARRAMAIAGQNNRKYLGAVRALAALSVLEEEGLRVGALPSLTVSTNGRFTAVSKSVNVSGQLSQKTRRLIANLHLDTERPFAGYRSFSKWFERASKRLGFSYSVHSLRHRFAVQLYQREKDILKLQRRLGHKSVHSTQAYLSSFPDDLLQSSSG